MIDHSDVSTLKIHGAEDGTVKITARAASKFTGKSHSVVSPQAVLSDMSAGKDGTVKFRVNSSELGLSGRFILEFEISKREVAKIYRTAENRALVAKIAELEAEVKRLKSK